MSLRRVYWIRFTLALTVAILSGFLRIWGLPAVTLVILVYILSHMVFKAMTEEIEPRKLLMEGMGTYFLTWFVAWTLIYNFLR